MINTKKKLIKLSIFFVALSLFLVACSNTGPDPETSEVETIVSTTESSITSTDSAEETVTSTSKETEQVIAPDFTLKDQQGVEHTLSDYLGKKIIINFWASWCGPCKAELPLLQEYYLEQGANREDLILLGVANPSDDALSQEMDQAGLIEFIEKNGLEYPTLMDHSGAVFGSYAVSALPTTFFIDVDGAIVGYFPGALTRDVIDYAMGQFK